MAKTPHPKWRRKSATKHEPTRTCVGCRRIASPDQLDRLARAIDGTVRVGRFEQGRGAWLCAGSVSCFDRAVRRGGLTRALHRRISTDEVGLLRAKLYGSDPEDPAESNKAEGS